MANDAYYKALSKLETQKLEQLKKEQKDLIASLNDAVDNGDITVNSEAWNEMQSSINDVTEAIAESEKALVEFNNEIRQISWDVFDFIQDRVSKITSEAEFLINLMDNKELYDDNGMLTEQGMATMAMHGANYNTYMEQSLAYAKELEKLNKEIANNPYDTKLIERREELLELQQENILAAEDEKDAIRDMVEEGINKELESLQDLIDKYNESLDAQQDLYDYQNKIAEQTKNIAELQKQLSVYEQDLSEETKAKVQQIKVSLEEAQNNLKETQYDQYITDQKKLLDDLYTAYEDTLNSRLDNLDALIIDMIEKINMNADGIKQTLISESANVGYVLTDEMQSIWNTESADGKVLTTYMGNFDAFSGNFSTYVTTQSTRWTSLQTTLGTINANIGKLVTASGQQAESDVKQTTNPITEATGTPVVETPAAPTPTPTPEPVQEEKVITVGGMINAGSAPIYSYAGSNKAYKQYFSDDPIYTVIKEQDGYLLVRHHNAKSGLTGWFKKSDVKAYKKGGLVDYTGLAQLDGTPGEPEMVLNSEDTKNLIELKDNLKEIRKGNIIYRPVDLNKKFGEISTLPEHLKVNIADDMVRILSNSMKEFHVPEVQRQSLSFGDINYEFNIAIDHVENYDDFVNKMRKDPKVEKMVQAMSVDQFMGRSKLGKYYV